MKLITHFIIDRHIEKLCHNSQLCTTRLNNYHAHFYSEIDFYLILGPKYPRIIDYTIGPYRLWFSDALGNKSLISISVNSCLLKTYNLILIFSFHNISLILITMCLA
jgi:hypothetical protein